MDQDQNEIARLRGLGAARAARIAARAAVRTRRIARHEPEPRDDGAIANAVARAAIAAESAADAATRGDSESAARAAIAARGWESLARQRIAAAHRRARTERAAGVIGRAERLGESHGVRAARGDYDLAAASLDEGEEPEPPAWDEIRERADAHRLSLGEPWLEASDEIREAYARGFRETYEEVWD